jgi:hypothetical protein
MNYSTAVVPQRIPLRVEGIMDMSPQRVGRRMIWKFHYADGSTEATYNSKKGFRLANLMMKETP